MMGQYKLIAAVVALIAAFGAGWQVNGWRLGEKMESFKRELADAAVKAEQEARKTEWIADQLADANGKLAAAELEAERAKGRVITKEVIKYVQADYAGKCDLPVKWVRIDTASAAGVSEDAVAIAGADGAGSGITDAGAIEIIAERNGICREELTKLKMLRQYVREQLAIFGRHNDNACAESGRER